jgi:hypothetical protein
MNEVIEARLRAPHVAMLAAWADFTRLARRTPEAPFDPRHAGALQPHDPRKLAKGAR